MSMLFQKIYRFRKDIVEAAREASSRFACIVNGCGFLAVKKLELYSLGVEVPVCHRHAGEIRGLDLDIISELTHNEPLMEEVLVSTNGGDEEMVRRLFPEFDPDGSNPHQASITIFSNLKYQRHKQLLEEGAVAIIDWSRGKPKVLWVNPYYILPYDPVIEEIVTGLKCRAVEGPPADYPEGYFDDAWFEDCNHVDEVGETASDDDNDYDYADIDPLDERNYVGELDIEEGDDE